ncbi:MAG: hypothetical protein ACPG4A_08650, partial [Pseudomonadales bacterium]
MVIGPDVSAWGDPLAACDAIALLVNPEFSTPEIKNAETRGAIPRSTEPMRRGIVEAYAMRWIITC